MKPKRQPALSDEKALSPACFRPLLEALEILHAHDSGEPFSQRLFAALRVIYQDSLFSFELFDPAGAPPIQHTDVPYDAEKLAAIMARVAEVAPHEHPAFPLMNAGASVPLRLSDLISASRLRRTALYHDAYRPLDIRYQLVLPLAVGRSLGGVTISRGTRDYTDEELRLALPLLRHIALAFGSDKLLHETTAARREWSAADALPLRRLGLSQRESEVLWWIGQGKRDREIGIILGISCRTVHRHVRAILGKLRAETRTAAVARLHEILPVFSK